MVAILDLEVKTVQTLKNKHFIGFVIPKIVEYGILSVVITCLVPKLFFISCFSKWRWAAIWNLEVKMFPHLIITISGFATLKIVEFGILYMHLYVYILLSSKVLAFQIAIAGIFDLEV